MNGWKENVAFSMFMVVVTALAVIGLLTYAQETLKKDREAFCRKVEAETTTPLMLVPPLPKRPSALAPDGRIMVAPPPEHP